METDAVAVGAPTSLLSPGERLGWVFRDRNLFRRRFPHPPPVLEAVPPELHRRAQSASGRFSRYLAASIGGTLAVLVLVACCGFVLDGPGGSASYTGLLFLVGLAGCAVTAGVVVWYRQTTTAVARVGAQMQGEYQQRLALWQGHKAEFDRQEQQSSDRLPEWGAATTPAGTRRLDIIGGSLWGWEAFLTVHGSSMLGTRGALTVLDLSGEAVSRELVALVAAAGVRTDVQILPQSLATSDLLAGLDARQFVDVIVEALHGDTDVAQRADRMVDDRLLMSVCGVLGTCLSLGRLGSALRLLLGETAGTPLLTDDERHAVEGLFTEEYRLQALTQLRRIEAYLHPLELLGVAAQPRPAAQLSCIAVVKEGSNARSELLTDLVVQWLTRRVVADPGSVPTLIVAGADEVPRRHLEQLSNVCERRDVRLVLLFRHLRDAAQQGLGSGAVVGFMKLGNPEEAGRAADFIGRHHTFVLSQLTRTMGGAQTHTSGETETTTEGRGGAWSPLGPRTDRWSKSRSRGTTSSQAEATSWSEATSLQRVYEYAVEPRTIQDLPDYAMLLVESRPQGPVLHAVDCNPEIATLPGVSMAPLPQQPVPEQPAVTAAIPSQHVRQPLPPA